MNLLADMNQIYLFYAFESVRRVLRYRAVLFRNVPVCIEMSCFRA